MIAAFNLILNFVSPCQRSGEDNHNENNQGIISGGDNPKENEETVAYPKRIRFYAIKSCHQTFLRALLRQRSGKDNHNENNQGIVSRGDNPKENEETVAYPKHIRFYAIKSCHKTFLRALLGNHHAKVDTQIYVGNNEKWTLMKNADGTYSFLTFCGTFLSAGSNGTSVVAKRRHGRFERFSLVKQSDETFCICTCDKRYIQVHPGKEGSRVDITSNYGPCARFTFQETTKY